MKTNMYRSAYKYSKFYSVLLLLLATGPVASGKKKPPATPHKTDVRYAQPQENNSPPRTVPVVKTLTEAQQQWLGNAIKGKKSDKKRCKKLLKNIAHREAYVREAVLLTLDQLLTNNPKVANKKSTNHLKNILQQVGVRKETQETLQLLGILAKANPKLALPISKIVIKLTENKKVEWVPDDLEREIIVSLTQTLVDQSAVCADYLLTTLYKQARDPKTAIVTRSSDITATSLIVAKQMLRAKHVAKNPQYIEMILNMALDGASLQVSVFHTPDVRSEAMQREAQALLHIIFSEHPSITTARYDTLVTLAQSMHPNMLAIAHLLPFSIIDHQYLKKPFALLTSTLELTDARVHKQAEIIYYRRTTQNITGGLTGLLASVIVDTATKGITKKLCIQEAQSNDDMAIGIPALRLLEEITTLDTTYLSTALTIFQKCLVPKKENDWTQKEVLDILARIVTKDDTCILKVIDIVTPHVHNKHTYVREATLNLLGTVLNIDAQHAQNEKVLDSLHKFSQNKHVKVRQLAKELLNKYSLSGTVGDQPG
jgi:hypothetical protein